MKLKIPAGTQNDQSFKVKGYGIPHPQSTAKGDHYVHVQVEIPKKIKRKEKELYQALVKEGKHTDLNSELFLPPDGN